MCGRFTLRTPAGQIAEFFQLIRDLVDWPEPRFNVAPTQSVLAIRRGDAGREPTRLRWGLIPSWAKDMKIGASLINARGETAAEKPAFRTAFRRRRCLIPADGFYEWKRDGSQKTPYLMTMQDESLFAFAGLWDRWKGPSGDVIESCSVITTTPNELMVTLHDRMPVILSPTHYDVWLDPAVGDVGALTSLLVPYPSDEMRAEQVSTVINNARNEVDPRVPG
jgi:putative SOS response-associated peptidase YedK